MRSLEVFALFCAAVGLVAADGGRIAVPELNASRCIGKDGVFLPIAGSCNKYVICVKGIAVLSTCGDYHFDARRSVCDLPANAGCISAVPEPLPVAETVCLGQVDGERLAVAGDKSKFYLCQQEKAKLQDCGVLRFDEKSRQCVQPIVRPLVAPCSGLPDGARVPVRGNQRQYYFCMHNRPFLKDCGSLYFSVKSSACAIRPDGEEEARPVPPLVVATPQVDEAMVLPPQERPLQHDPVAQRMCKNQRFGARVALPGTCSQYYICMGNTGLLKSCGLMQFNPINMACDVPSNVHCKVQSGVAVYGPEDTLAHPTPVNSTAAGVCYGQRDGIFVAAPGKCAEFYFCFKNHGYLKTCGHRHFSPITLSCVELEMSNCVEETPAVLETETPVNSCVNRESGVLLKHPTDCGKYIICDHQVPVEMVCPGGLHFNVERSYCDWPRLAGCN